jgi:hypothetical protein
MNCELISVKIDTWILDIFFSGQVRPKQMFNFDENLNLRLFQTHWA